MLFSFKVFRFDFLFLRFWFFILGEMDYVKKILICIKFVLFFMDKMECSVNYFLYFEFIECVGKRFLKLLFGVSIGKIVL